MVAVLDLALRLNQEQIGSAEATANSARTSTFQGVASFPLGGSFAATDSFGGAAKSRFDFSSVTTDELAATDGLSEGSAISQALLGDLNVVQGVLSTALSQKASSDKKKGKKKQKGDELQLPPTTADGSGSEDYLDLIYQDYYLYEAEYLDEDVREGVGSGVSGITARRRGGGVVVGDLQLRQMLPTVDGSDSFPYGDVLSYTGYDYVDYDGTFAEDAAGDVYDDDKNDSYLEDRVDIFLAATLDYGRAGR